MLQQTLAMFIDGYRELNSKRIFGVAIAISIVVMGMFAGIKVTADDLTVFGYSVNILGLQSLISFLKPETVYMYIYGYLIVGIWLTLGATSLGMFSVASLFPDFMTGGAIDLYLSKPISRLRLFFTKYIMGLVFVMIQMTLFAIMGFFILGLRAGIWESRIFLSIPIVTCYFSYLYSINVFFGVFTRSTMVSVIMTFVIWGIISMVQYGEQAAFMITRVSQNNVSYYQKLVDANQRDMDRLNTPVPDATEPVSPGMIKKTQDALQNSKRQRDNARRQFDIASKTDRILKGFALILPKTGETGALLNNKLLNEEDARLLVNPVGDEHRQRHAQRTNDPAVKETMQREAAVESDAQMEIRNRSVWWIVGTSLGFEAVLISVAAWWFCRREY